MSSNGKKNVALITAAVLLFLALLDGWDYGFFTVLRFIVFVTTAYVAWMAFAWQREKWTWIFGFIAVLFNPFFPIYLDRGTWVIVDLVTGVFLFATTFLVKFEKRISQ